MYNKNNKLLMPPKSVFQLGDLLKIITSHVSQMSNHRGHFIKLTTPSGGIK